jgi:hypothetical protein
MRDASVLVYMTSAGMCVDNPMSRPNSDFVVIVTVSVLFLFY